MSKIAFVGGMVFDSTSEEFYSSNVICEDGFVIDITNDAPSDDCEIINIAGKYLIPGLIDVHTHGIAGYDFCSAKEDDIPKMCARYASLGTTSIMATLASDKMTNLTNSVFAINQNRLNAKDGCANIIGIHLEGRYLNPDMKGAHALEFLAKPNAEEFTSLALSMMPLPIHASMAPEMDGGDELIKAAMELGVTVGIAHTNATFDEAKYALSLGAKSFTHTFNAMTKIHHRMPGATVCALVTDDAYAEIIADGQHSHPAMVQLAFKSKPSDKLVLITDSMSAAGCPDGDNYSIAGTHVIVKNGVAINEFGVLAGSTLTMFKAVKNLMSFCGISLNEALKYATTNPANMINADFVGKIEKCYRADFITINDIESPEIDTVYVGGKRV